MAPDVVSTLLEILGATADLNHELVAWVSTLLEILEEIFVLRFYNLEDDGFNPS